MSADPVKKQAEGELDDEQLETVAGGFALPPVYTCATCGLKMEGGAVFHMCSQTTSQPTTNAAVPGSPGRPW